MQKIPLTPDIAYPNQYGKDDVSKLLTRDLVKFTVYNPIVKPYRVTFDLDEFSKVIPRQIHLFVNNGAPFGFSFYGVRKSDGAEVLLLKYLNQGYNPNEQVHGLPDAVQVDMSRIIIESQNAAGDFPEWFEVWGDYEVGTVKVQPQPAKPMTNLFGAVVKPWDVADNKFPEKIPLMKETGVKRVRIYVDGGMVRDDNGNFTMQGGDWRIIDNLKVLKAAGIKAQICYLDTGYYPWRGQDKNNIETYMQLARDITEMGKIIKVNGECAEAIEVLNEENMWYTAEPGVTYMNGAQIAMMMSLCYDGHKGKYPVGLKSSGSAALLSIGGLATADLEIWYEMKDWVNKNRGGDWPFDIYSYHHYSSSGGQRSGTKGGLSPVHGMLPQMKKIQRFGDKYAPNILRRIGEWGWDTSPYSELNSPAFGPYTRYQVNAFWTAEAPLLMAECGMEGSSYYWYAMQHLGIEDSNGTMFWSMALTTQEKWEGTPEIVNGKPTGRTIGHELHRTPAGEYFKQLSDLITGGNYKFKERLSTDTPNVLVFTNGNNDLYAIWGSETLAYKNDAPAYTERTGTYTLNVKGKILRFADSGPMQSEPFNGGQISWNAKPFFILNDGVVPAPEPPKEKEIFHRGYWNIKGDWGKRFYYINYTDGTWVQTNGRYEPIKKAP